ncbi:hypothetical protein [Actinomadura litoris]|uniref:hypothetical protein n=1 Tax=Actinomadura litoris TaxID=2678616 RepID=UPI001FA7ACF6|nr:hypothetical protein [Actinomadura litoris]
MKLADLERAMWRQGCRKRTPDKGPHTKWICPCGQHRAIIPRHREISALVVGNTVKGLACLEEGWLA